MSQPVTAPAAEIPAAVTADVIQPLPQATETRPGQGENLSGADVRAAFAASRRARRAPRSDAPSNKGNTATTNPPNPTAEATPAPTGDQGTDDSNLASTPSPEAAEVNALAGTAPAADGEESGAGEAASADGVEVDEAKAAEELLDDPDAIAEMSEDQIAGIKDRALRKAIRRIHKLTARLRASEAQARPEPKSADAQPAAPVTPGVTGDAEVTRLASRIQTINRALAWARSNPDGGEFTGPDGKVIATFDADQTQRLLDAAPSQLAELTTQRALRMDKLANEDRVARQAAYETAKTAYPWLAKQDSDEYAMASRVVQQLPALRQVAEWPMWVADAIEGRKARMARQSQAESPKPTPRPTPPRIPVPTGATAPQGDPMARQLKEAEAKFEQTGRIQDLKRVESLKRQMRRTQAVRAGA